MMQENLAILGLTADIAITMLIWLVQLVIYPAFRMIEPELFHDWHRRYMNTISCFVIPLMFTQAIALGQQLLSNPSWPHLVAAAAVLTAWTSTFLLSVPCHNVLQTRGNLPELTKRLIRTNWIRTVAWSIAGLLGISQQF